MPTRWRLTGSENYNTVDLVNDATGIHNTTTTGTGSASRAETRSGATTTATTALSYTDTQGGNYLDGSLTLTRSGIDRYFALGHFTDTSNPGLGVTGTLDFSPVGLPVFIGPGPIVPTGGGPLDLNPHLVDSVFSSLSQPAGSTSNGGPAWLRGGGIGFAG